MMAFLYDGSRQLVLLVDLRDIMSLVSGIRPGNITRGWLEGIGGELLWENNRNLRSTNINNKLVLVEDTPFAKFNDSIDYTVIQSNRIKLHPSFYFRGIIEE